MRETTHQEQVDMKRDNSPRSGRYERDNSQKQVDMKRDNSPRAGRYEERQLTKIR